MEAKEYWLQSTDIYYNEGAQRYNMLSIVNDDVFAADAYYQKNCYNDFLYIPTGVEDLNPEVPEINQKVLEHILQKIERKVIKDKHAYLLSVLQQDCLEISEEFGLHESPACLRHTYRIKRTLTDHFGSKIGFCNLGKYVAVHPSDAYASLKGHGLREDDTAKAFANLVRMKPCERDEKQKWPPLRPSF